MSLGKIDGPHQGSPALAQWDSFEFLHSGDQFLNKALSLISRSQETITIESYIFLPDRMGLPIIDALKSAQDRGVKIRVLIDGVGCAPYLRPLQNHFESRRIPLRVFNPIPALSLFGMIQTDLSPGSPMPRLLRSGFTKTIAKMNRRNHRKAIVVDHQHAIIGGINISDLTCSSVWGERAWRDSSAYIQSKEVKVLCAAFDRAWTRAPQLGWATMLSAPHHNHLPHELQFQTNSILLNDKSPRRRLYMRDFFLRLHHAQKRIYFVTPYFVPTRRLLKCLVSAAERGVDVQLIVPKQSDVRSIDFLATSYLSFLWSKGIRIFRYQPTVLHAKYSIIDELGFMGSGNLNHRSLIHDLELEVRFNQGQGLEDLLSQWNLDQSQSLEAKQSKDFSQSFWIRIFSRILFWVRYYL